MKVDKLKKCDKCKYNNRQQCGVNFCTVCIYDLYKPKQKKVEAKNNAVKTNIKTN